MFDELVIVFHTWFFSVILAKTGNTDNWTVIGEVILFIILRYSFLSELHGASALAQVTDKCTRTVELRKLYAQIISR